jgi:hypothetical protein
MNRLPGSAKPNSVQLVRVVGVQHPAVPGARPALDHRVHQRHAEPAATAVGQHEDVRQVRVGDAVGERAGERHHPARAGLVPGDHPPGVGELGAEVLTGTEPRPVRLGGQERPGRVLVDAGRVVVELVAVGSG